MRLFAMVRTTSSMAVLRINLPEELPKWMPRTLVKEIILLQSRPMQIQESMVTDMSV